MAPFLELEHLIDALKEFSRPSAEGREALANLFCVGTRVNNKEKVVVEALCIRTTNIDEPPVKINIIMDKKKQKKSKIKLKKSHAHALPVLLKTMYANMLLRR